MFRERAINQKAFQIFPITNVDEMTSVEDQLQQAATHRLLVIIGYWYIKFTCKCL